MFQQLDDSCSRQLVSTHSISMRIELIIKITILTLSRAAGLGPGLIVFGTGMFLPRRYLVIFIQSYFSSRSLMRELVSLQHLNYAAFLSWLTSIISLSHTLPELVSPKSKRRTGFMTERGFYSDLVLVSTYSFEPLFWVYLCMALQKHLQHILSQRLPTPLHLLVKIATLLRASKNGRTSMHSWTSSSINWTP